jgi:hypothetical protein
MAHATSGIGADRTSASPGLDDGTLETSEAAHREAGEADTEGESAAFNLARAASRRAERARVSAAAGLDTAANALHTGAERVAGAAHRAGNVLESGADYVRSHELSDIGDDLVQVLKNYPAATLVGAAALGFILGRALYRS